MRTLLLLRGAPGCGKSTFIKNNNLEQYALSADEIRLKCQSAQQTIYGSETISQNNDTTTWKVLFNLLEVRMQNGEFTVIDATNSKSEEMNRYKKMCDTYRYRIYCIDFTKLPIEECKRRNLERESLKQVPEEVIDKIYARFKNQKIPSGIKVIKPEELDTIWMNKIDFSSYRKIVHIGDIHGCYTALLEYFKNVDFRDESILYIFTGDYLDRGIENVEVINFLLDISKYKNVIMLEGNHERNLYIYGNGGTSRDKEFEFNTKKQLEKAHVDLKQLRMFYRTLIQCAWYTYDDKEIFVSHGGVATLPENLTKLATTQLINGVGTYNDGEIVAETWMKTTCSNQYQIFGHRNAKNSPIRLNDRVFDLEGKVEFGGDLRIRELTHDGFNEVTIKNNVFKEIVFDAESFDNSEEAKNVSDVVIQMRNNKRNIVEKNFGHISSFNFTKDVFFDKKRWNDMTVKARGLYIDIEKFKVAARSYDKFFNINEMPNTKFDMLQYTLQFPVTAYVKENGFLGLVAYDEYEDYEGNLLVTTKSSIVGDYAVWLRNMLKKKVSTENIEKIVNYCKENDVTFVFECVDMENDPHIIEYPESNLYLLAIVKNDLKFNQLPYNDLCTIGKNFGLKVKEKAYVLNNWSEFFDWYTEVTQDDYKFNDRIIEGFVIEDSVGFMTKLKLNYYTFWKHMRGIADKTMRHGYITHTSQLYNAESNEFYAFLQRLYNSVETKEERDNLPHNIITLRNMFYREKEI